jgi:hypothetical protein
MSLFFLSLLSASAFALNVNITTNIEGGGKPKVIGQTNLPDGMKLMIKISRKVSAYMAQDKATVLNGRFQAGPFTQKGQPLNSGTYTLEITSPFASLQPQPVRDVIGKDGGNLQGPYVGELPLNEQKVEYVDTFEVGDGALEQLDRKTRRRSEEESYKWWSETCELSCASDKKAAARGNTAFNWDSCFSGCMKMGREVD